MRFRVLFDHKRGIQTEMHGNFHWKCNDWVFGGSVWDMKFCAFHGNFRFHRNILNLLRIRVARSIYLNPFSIHKLYCSYYIWMSLLSTQFYSFKWFKSNLNLIKKEVKVEVEAVENIMQWPRGKMHRNWSCIRFISTRKWKERKKTEDETEGNASAKPNSFSFQIANRISALFVHFVWIKSAR